MVVNQTRAELRRHLGSVVYTKRLVFSARKLRTLYNSTSKRPFDAVYRKIQERLFSDPRFLEVDFTAVFCAVGNSLKHGLSFSEKKEGSLILTLSSGSRGLLVTLTETGSGFNFQHVKRLYRQRKPYWKFAGVGWLAYEKSDVLVSFSDRGRNATFFYVLNSYQNCADPCEEFPVSRLYLKGFYLREKNTIKFKRGTYKGTGSVFNMALLLIRDPLFNTLPINIHQDTRGRLVVYGGRHRTLAYILAGRTKIKGKRIFSNDPRVRNLNSRHKTEYYRKRYNKATRVLEQFIITHRKEFRLFDFSRRYLPHEHDNFPNDRRGLSPYARLIPEELKDGPWPQERVRIRLVRDR